MVIIVLLVLVTGCQQTVQNSEVEESDDLHDYSVEVEGKLMKQFTITEIANLWEIDDEVLLAGIISEFDLIRDYGTESILDDLRLEVPFSPAQIKQIAERIKVENSSPAVESVEKAEEKIAEDVVAQEITGDIVTECPNGLINDPYPGNCGQYIDENDNAICDMSEV